VPDITVNEFDADESHDEIRELIRALIQREKEKMGDVHLPDVRSSVRDVRGNRDGSSRAAW